MSGTQKEGGSVSQTIQGNPKALIESVVRKLAPASQDEARQLFNIFLDNLTVLSPGGNLLQPGGTKAGASAPPVGVSHETQGANGVLTVSITNPPGTQSTPIYHEFSYSPNISFVGPNVTTLPPTTDTTINIPAVGSAPYCRLRSSYDRKSWTNYQLSATAPIDAGYVESSALSSGATFNRSNFATVEAAFDGSAAEVNISGTGGPFTPYASVKGSVQSLRPSATIVATELSPNQFVGYDGSQYHIEPLLADVLADNLEPVGAITAGGGAGGGGASGGNGGRLSALQV